MQGAVGQRGAEIDVVPRQHSSFAVLPAIRWFLELIQNHLRFRGLGFRV